MDSPDIPIGHYRLGFRALAPIHLPVYAGSAWRGLFGRALKRTVCVTREPDCKTCLLYRSCVYPYVFETPPGPEAEKMRRYSAAPHPYVLRPATDGRRHYAPGDGLDLELVLIGRANQHLPYVIHAFRQAGELGLGPSDGRFALEGVEQLADDAWRPIYREGATLAPRPVVSPPLPPCPAQVQLTLHTPLRLMRERHLVTPRCFAFHDLFRNLMRRLSMLRYFHTDRPLEVDFKGLTETSRRVPIREPRLQWHDWARYSSRQKARVDMGGVVGTLRLEGEDLEPLWPYLWVGQWLHAGTGAVMGLGRYAISAPRPQRTPDGEATQGTRPADRLEPLPEAPSAEGADPRLTDH
jgi:hypothetical protein